MAKMILPPFGYRAYLTDRSSDELVPFVFDFMLWAYRCVFLLHANENSRHRQASPWKGGRRW